ncbi:hypothetical protein BU24DRAFT_427096 [Aaosphaeria arxii CBS 175.79]|uniref:Uncharacterized protein n=1 Tax=Aaosphaeria arxii CBS 175.79 TaxID=1450172 RepID=A0A6A5XDL2_9PLEO|nr:uncharacterized protein BU24DRAFT_427096 [Aaosphaeria arxii CBS 175.79]KAF2010906.1 hypothetical protein BU24DRAFT_427096 [Aaosphaeria arxii CBS 175.79]
MSLFLDIATGLIAVGSLSTAAASWYSAYMQASNAGNVEEANYCYAQLGQCLAEEGHLN